MARALPFRWRKGKRDTLSSPATYELRRAGELFAIAQQTSNSASSPPVPPRPVAYGKGYAAGKADAEAFLKAGERKPAAPTGTAALRAGLKNATRTTTRRLDEANMPRDMQGIDGKDWG